MKKPLLLGYTRSGYPVECGCTFDPEVEPFLDWTPGDHADAGGILAEHGERETDPDSAEWCAHWAQIHRATAKRYARIRTATEVAIRPTGRRRRRVVVH